MKPKSLRTMILETMALLHPDGMVFTTSSVSSRVVSWIRAENPTLTPSADFAMVAGVNDQVSKFQDRLRFRRGRMVSPDGGLIDDPDQGHLSDSQPPEVQWSWLYRWSAMYEGKKPDRKRPIFMTLPEFDSFIRLNQLKAGQTMRKADKALAVRRDHPEWDDFPHMACFEILGISPDILFEPDDGTDEAPGDDDDEDD